jgi:enediyne biosynthesis protein E4
MKQPLFRLFLTFIAVSFLFACKNDNKSSNDISEKIEVPADALFHLLPSAQTGINFQNTLKENYQTNVIVYDYLYNGGGVGVIDVNKDGLQDLFYTSTMEQCKLYLNKGNLKFEDITATSGIVTEGLKTGVAIADVNNDGWQDIYVCRTGTQATEIRSNLLFINNKNNTFTESSKSYGLEDFSMHTQANFFDYDLDGDLDLYLLNIPANFKNANSVRLQDLGGGKIAKITKPMQPLDSDKLYRNDGNNHFTDVTLAAGIENSAYGLGIKITDINEDGYPDIYVSNDYVEPDFVYINNKNGTFTDKGLSIFRHFANNSMGVDIGDINNDGYYDVFTLDMLADDYALQQQRASTMKDERYNNLVKYNYGHQPSRNVLQLNNGNGTYSDVSCLAGVFKTDWSWATLMQDFDNNGLRDIYVTNGYYRDVTNIDYIEFIADSISKIPGGISPKNFPDINQILNLIPRAKLLNYAYSNRGDLTFEDASVKWGLAEKSYSNGTAWADLDNDGDLDLLVNNLGQEAFFYQNTAADRKLGNWFQLKLEGSAKNPFATGAKIRAWAGKTIFAEELNPIRGFVSSVESLVHFGVGNITSLDKVEILFPDGKLVSLTNVPVNQRLTIKYADAKTGKLSPLPAFSPFVKEITNTRGLDFVHTEDVFNDFGRERLLPWKLSTPGPALATGDVNGDKLDDFYIGGATGQAGALFVQAKSGTFAQISNATWETDKGYEDAAATFLDADSDGDLDLLVASGGNAQPLGANAYPPRMYLNDGKGNFARANVLPNIDESIATVLAADYDADGDQDLFLGGASVPAMYPTLPKSYILKNEKGTFQDVTATIAPDFAKIGMVHALEWADLNGDKSPELLVTGEWMNINVFINKGGKLELATTQYGLDKTAGFWRSIEASDFDGDGDIDLVCGNLGTNSRLSASETEPLTMYAKDFDNNGSMDPIMCLTQYKVERPIAFRTLMLKQIPALKKKFVRTVSYAKAKIEDFYPRSELSKSQQLHATELKSVYFENKNGTFVAHTLPNEAQIAPINDLVSMDVNKDGHLDLICVGNDYTQQVETGRIDSGNGLILLGDGKGNFKPMLPRESGFWATKEAHAVRLLHGLGAKTMVLVGNTNDRLQAMEL